MNEDPTFEKAISILHFGGNFEAINILRVALVYRDDKIEIKAYMQSDNRTVDRLIIALWMPSPRKADRLTDSGNLLFGIQPRTKTEGDESDRTPVYFWQLLGDTGFPTFHRPGRWERYLEHLIAEDKKGREQVRTLNNQPIDDAAFFSDIQTE